METSIVAIARLNAPMSPHSLGTLIEWKQNSQFDLDLVKIKVPTRWGH